MTYHQKEFDRRGFLLGGSASLLALGGAQLLPAWALSASDGNMGLHHAHHKVFDLNIDRFPVTLNGRAGEAVGVNGTLPAPLIRFREGDEVVLNVRNNLDEDTSIHWHGLLVPFEMDGVPGVTFPGIAPGETFSYRYAVPQSGTYWYHSHSGLQEQQGHYGPIIIDPKGADPVSYDREYVLVLSDWSYENPYRIFSKLKKNAEVYNMQERTLRDLRRDIKQQGMSSTLADRAMWGMMRMSAADIADVTGETYTYLMNGHGSQDNWNGVFQKEERVRLRIINASAMTIFNFRIPGLPMSVVAADGLNVKPVETDEFQIGIAETYDAIVEPQEDRAYALVAESIDRSGMVVGTLGPKAGMRAQAPQLRQRPTLTMRDMGMAGHAGHGDHAGTSNGGVDHSSMDHGAMNHGDMDHSAHSEHAKMDHSQHKSHQMHGAAMSVSHDHKKGPGVDMLNDAPLRRLNEPGLGLENVPHRALTYDQLQSLEPNPDQRKPEREMEIHLTGNMHRYMWSFDGVKFAHIKEPIVFHEGERVRVTLVNDTMMSHPIHLHGMFFDLVTNEGAHKPRKHTVIVKPAEKLSFDVTAEHLGDWAFHCHLLFHMHAGMMQVVSVRPKEEGHGAHEMHHHEMDEKKMNHDEQMNHDEHTDHSNHKMDHGEMNHENHEHHKNHSNHKKGEH